MCFIDLTAAFDKMNRQKLLRKLQERAKLYTDTKIKIWNGQKYQVQSM